MCRCVVSGVLWSVVECGVCVVLFYVWYYVLCVVGFCCVYVSFLVYVCMFVCPSSLLSCVSSHHASGILYSSSSSINSATTSVSTTVSSWPQCRVAGRCWDRSCTGTVTVPRRWSTSSAILRPPCGAHPLSHPPRSGQMLRVRPVPRWLTSWRRHWSLLPPIPPNSLWSIPPRSRGSDPRRESVPSLEWRRRAARLP
jgi:hypothetical protein